MFVPKVWGYEDIAVNTDSYCGKRMFIKEQHQCSIHRHAIKDEVMMVGSGGLLYFEIGNDPKNLTGFFMEENERIRIVPPNTWHRFTAMRDTTIYEFSTHDEATDSIRDISGGKITDADYKGLLQKYVGKHLSENGWIEIGEAKEVADVAHSQGKVVGMCNGCFDLLHLGHIQLLSQAKQRCDVLFVGINDDDAVRQLKGPSRPFVNAIGRMGMVAACRFVDHVVRVPNTNCIDLVDAIRPNVYITTSEYGNNGPEGMEVKKQGGSIAVVPMIADFNTTKLSMAIQSKKGLGV